MVDGSWLCVVVVVCVSVLFAKHSTCMYVDRANRVTPKKMTSNACFLYVNVLVRVRVSVGGCFRRQATCVDIYSSRSHAIRSAFFFSQIFFSFRQVAASLAWGYFQGPSWALAGAGLAPACMLAVTARRLSTLKDREYRGGNSGSRSRRNQPWQKPVDAVKPANTRRNARSKAVPYK